MFNNVVLAAAAWGVSLRAGILNLLKGERGQDLVEYVVLIGAIGVVASIALFTFDMNGVFVEMADRLETCLTFSDTCGDW